MKKILIQTDGASRGNPGLAAVGFLVKNDKGELLFQEGVFLGHATNNEAEYKAVVLALTQVIKILEKEMPLDVEIRADSLLIVNQLSGKFKIKNPNLQSLFYQVKELEKIVGKVEYTYTPRENNHLADQLANQALDLAAL